MAFRRNIAILTGLAAISFFALTLSAQSGQGSNAEDDANAKCEATRTKDQQCIVINQRFATSNFFSAPFNFAPFTFANPEPTSCLVQIDPCPANQTVPVHNASATGANVAMYAGEGNAGKFTGQGISQSVVTFPLKPCKLDDGTPGFELHLIGHIASTRFDTGDLLFEHGGLNAHRLRTPPGDSMNGTVDLVNGFGKYAGARVRGQFSTDKLWYFRAPNTAARKRHTIPWRVQFSHGSFIATFTYRRSKHPLRRKRQPQMREATEEALRPFCYYTLK